MRLKRQTLLQILLYFLVVLTLAVEQAAGLPLLSLSLILRIASQTEIEERFIWLAAFTLPLALAYHLPLYIALALLLILSESHIILTALIRAELSRQFLAVILTSAIMAVLLHYQWTELKIIYHLVLGLVIVGGLSYKKIYQQQHAVTFSKWLR